MLRPKVTLPSFCQICFGFTGFLLGFLYDFCALDGFLSSARNDLQTGTK